ncbi:hypothetical protein [Streptomyces sp. NPDC006285]|uniref:hypothetical protein n=1 Tax=Streptomyces sp. NPDC006285 TaxID=3364742 RepID=UPI00367C1E5A
MVYKFGDNPQCAKRARVITRLLLDEADTVTASHPLITAVDQDVAHQMLGWWQFTNRTADLLMRSYDSGFTVEAAGQMRNLIEDAHCIPLASREHGSPSACTSLAPLWGSSL